MQNQETEAPTPDSAKVYTIQFDPNKLVKDYDSLLEIQDRIRTSYIQPQLNPHYFCSYEGFAKVFPAPNIYQANKSEHLNIIDVHLRYRQFIHQKMAIYKWAPSIIVVGLTRFHPLGLLFPLLYVKFVDKYFRDFFIWKHSSQKIINIRSQFAVKLSKQKNKLRRAFLYHRLKQYLAQSNQEIPNRYIKFGENSQYVFHTRIKSIEQSSIYLTPFFENYMYLNNLSSQSFRQLISHFKDLKQSFLQYKKIENKKQLPIFIDCDKLLKYKQIKNQEVYNLSKQVQLRFRRWLEIGKYLKTGQFFMSGFTFTDLLHFNKHYDLLTPQKFNYQSNTADFVIFYGIYLTGKLAKTIIKRAVRM